MVIDERCLARWPESSASCVRLHIPNYRPSIIDVSIEIDRRRLVRQQLEARQAPVRLVRQQSIGAARACQATDSTCE